MKTLIQFRHGLGDAIQFTTVLNHLRKYRDAWEVDVATLVGKHSAFNGLCNKIFVEGRENPPCCQYKLRYDLGWHECHTSYADSPSTKVERCLREEFGITPDPALCRYTIQRSAESDELARQYLGRICDQPANAAGKFSAVLIHYEGNTSAEQKNLPTETIRKVCEDIIETGYTPIILDWDFRSPLVDRNGSRRRIHCPDPDEPLWLGTGTGDAEALAALIEHSALMIGIDSGPLHVAGATTTPTLGVWTAHHPLHYFGHSENITHLVPQTHRELIRGTQEIGYQYFTNNYLYQEYQDLANALRTAVRSHLENGQFKSDGLIKMRGFWIREDNGEQDLVIVQDIVEEDSYGLSELRESPSVVVDVGAHIGCFSSHVHQKYPQAQILAAECCPENFAALKKNIGGFATVIEGAVTYEANVALMNSVYANCRSTGGSTIVSRDEITQRVAAHELADQPSVAAETQYWGDLRPIKTKTLEDLMSEHGFDRIDLLKLDCEGSEYSILRGTTSLDRISVIVGEYHGRAEFEKLVAERFSDWELRIRRDGDIGTFWLINPNQRQLPRSYEPSVTIAAAGNTDFRAKLEASFHPDDRDQLDKWLPYYEHLFNFYRTRELHRVIEIGVRAGYSSLCLFMAHPSASILGIDANGDENEVNTHGGRKGLWQHAQGILKEFDFQLMLANSQGIQLLPKADLIYVDGDHSFRGCLSDLRLAERSTNLILVDDVFIAPTVRQACDTFTSEHPEFRRTFIDNKATGLLLFERD